MPACKVEEAPWPFLSTPLLCMANQWSLGPLCDAGLCSDSLPFCFPKGQRVLLGPCQICNCLFLLFFPQMSWRNTEGNYFTRSAIHHETEDTRHRWPSLDNEAFWIFLTAEYTDPKRVLRASWEGKSSATNNGHTQFWYIQELAPWEGSHLSHPFPYCISSPASSLWVRLTHHPALRIQQLRWEGLGVWGALRVLHSHPCFLSWEITSLICKYISVTPSVSEPGKRKALKLVPEADCV